MWKYALGLVLAIGLVQPTRLLAADNPSSFVPHANGHAHTYGSPISPAIVGHKNSHHKPAPKTHS
jgi:hypothetical protein